MSSDLLYRAFSEPVRRRALRLLSRRPLCVCDLVAALGLPQPTVSRHLASLQEAGLVRATKSGRWRHYALSAPRGGVAAGLLASLKAEPDIDGDVRRLAALIPRAC